MAEVVRSAKGRQRQDEILETGLAVLADQGYRQTSLRGIGRALGVQPAHLLHYFATKEALLEAIIARWDATSEAYVRENGGRFLDLWPEVVARNARVPGLVHLYTALAAEAADPQHPSRAFFRARFERVREAIEVDLVRRRDEGRAAAGLDVRATATRLIGFADGMQLHWLIDPAIDMAHELRTTIGALTA